MTQQQKGLGLRRTECLEGCTCGNSVCKCGYVLANGRCMNCYSPSTQRGEMPRGILSLSAQEPGRWMRHADPEVDAAFVALANVLMRRAWALEWSGYRVLWVIAFAPEIRASVIARVYLLTIHLAVCSALVAGFLVGLQL